MRTGDASLTSGGNVSLLAAETITLGARSLRMSLQDALAVNSNSDLSVSAGRKMSLTVSEQDEPRGDSLQLHSVWSSVCPTSTRISCRWQQRGAFLFLFFLEKRKRRKRKKKKKKRARAAGL